jgi:hypothetical protein
MGFVAQELRLRCFRRAVPEGGVSLAGTFIPGGVLILCSRLGFVCSAEGLLATWSDRHQQLSILFETTRPHFLELRHIDFLVRWTSREILRTDCATAFQKTRQFVSACSKYFYLVDFFCWLLYRLDLLSIDLLQFILKVLSHSWFKRGSEIFIPKIMSRTETPKAQHKNRTAMRPAAIYATIFTGDLINSEQGQSTENRAAFRRARVRCNFQVADCCGNKGKWLPN